jgi:hypothetical protein
MYVRSPARAPMRRHRSRPLAASIRARSPARAPMRRHRGRPLAAARRVVN